MTIKDDICLLANKYAKALKSQVDKRILDMDQDDVSHFLIYRVLGIDDKEGKLIDIYQNKGRFLYKYAGSFLQDAAKQCFKEAFPESSSIRIPNTEGRLPRTFEIDCLVGTDAHEIKWKDATTDGDHITKEHTRIRVIHNVGYKPIRVMFYYPNRDQAIRIQIALEALYHEIGGDYYYGNSAWEYIGGMTGIDLKRILEDIAKERMCANEK